MTTIVEFAQAHRARWPIAAAALGGVVLIAVIAIVATRSGESDLDRLNEDVRALNQEIAAAQSGMTTYAAAEPDASNWRLIYEDVSGGDETVLGIAGQHLATAQERMTTAQDSLAAAGEPRAEYSEFSESERSSIEAAREMARNAATNAWLAVDELQAVRALANDVLPSYRRTFIGLQLGSRWDDGANTPANSEACYYREIIAIVNPDGTAAETIVDDGASNQPWKIFTVAEYNAFVRQGIVPAMDEREPSQEQVGRYLCGDEPQTGTYGALGKPEFTLVKENDRLAYAEGTQNAMVGNPRYGAWCVPEGGGYRMLPEGTPEVSTSAPTPTPIPGIQALTQEPEWCWHMPEEGGDPRFYYFGSFRNGLWTYTQGPRRCYSCDAQSWSGGPLVPSSQMGRVSGAGAPNVRTGTQDGGPGTGK